MTIQMRGLLVALVAVAGVSVAVPAIARGRVARTAAPMSPVRPMTDDKCDAACDAASDKCSIEAGKDAAKQRQCDSSYETCLRNCQSPG